MSEWTTPPQSAEYRTPQSGLGVLRALITALSRRLSALEGAAPLKQAGIYLTTLGMRIASSLLVEGDLTSTGAADITGTTHIGGATDIDGTLNVDADTTLGGDVDIAGDGQVTGIFRSTNYVAGVSGWRLFPDGSVKFNGTLDVTGATALDGATTIGGTLGVTGATTLGSTLALSGTGTVTGTLRSSNFVAGVSGWRLTSTGLEVNTITVKDLLIGNAALASPTIPAAGTAGSGTVSVATSTTPTDFATVTFTVPTGFTTALVMGVSAARYAGNVQRIAMVISGDEGQYQSGNTVEGNLTTSHTRLITGLSGGGSVTVLSRMHTNTGAGVAYPLTSAQVTFYR